RNVEEILKHRILKYFKIQELELFRYIESYGIPRETKKLLPHSPPGHSPLRPHSPLLTSKWMIIAKEKACNKHNNKQTRVS
ncbi:hypothetical protein VIGAN_08186200, partial [Vigna angularis var. angularis]